MKISSDLKKNCRFEKHLLIWEIYIVNDTSRPPYYKIVYSLNKNNLLVKQK